MVGYTQPVPSNHPSRYKTLAVRDEDGQIIGYINNPKYIPIISENDPIPIGDPMDNLKFTCTVYCEYKGDKGMGACEDCQYLITTDEAYGACEYEQLIAGEDSNCTMFNRRVCFEECLDCLSFEPHTNKPTHHQTPKEKVKEKPVEPLTDLDILDIIGETGLEIS